MQNKVGRPPYKAARVLGTLAERKHATAQELDTDAAYLASLMRRGWVTVRAYQRSGFRGRPTNVYGLTRSGYARARTLARQFNDEIYVTEGYQGGLLGRSVRRAAREVC